MNRPTKIQRTVEFDEVLHEASLIIEAEVRVGLQSIIELIDSYERVDRKDHDFLLFCIDDLRRKLFGLDIHLGDASSMVASHKAHIESQARAEPQKSNTEVSALQSAMAGLKSSMSSHTSAVKAGGKKQDDPKE